MPDNISHIFKSAEGSKNVVFERVGHVIDLRNSTDEFTGHFIDKINSDIDYVVEAISPTLFEIDLEIFKDQTSREDINKARIISTYVYNGSIYKFENEFKELIVKVPSNYTTQKLKNLIEGQGVILDQAIFSYYLIGVPPDGFEDIKALFKANNIVYEVNWQTVSDGPLRNIIGITNQYIEQRLLPPNPAFKAINFDKDPSEAIRTPQIKIALLDNGVQGEHPDLQQVFDRVNSKSLFKDENTQLPNRKETHGTRCAGILAGFSRDKRGILGTGGGSSLISYRIIKGTGELGREFCLSNFKLIKAFLLAYDNNCAVINCSWTLPYESTLLYDVIEFVAKEGRDGKGTAIVFSAGNKGKDITFPANCTNSITVSAVDLYNKPYIYSWKTNHGAKILIAAPGTKVYTTDFVNGAGGDHVIAPDNEREVYVNHSIFYGTSAAAPIIAGFIAHIYQTKEDCTLEEIREILQRSCTEIDHTDNTTNNYYGCGVIDYHKLKNEISNL